MRFFFPNQPTQEQADAVLNRLLAGEILTSADISAMDISPRMVIHTLRAKMGVPVATIELIEENDPHAVALAEDFEPDYAEHDSSTDPDAVAGKQYVYLLKAAEIARRLTDPEGQAKDYAEIRRLNTRKRAAACTARVLRKHSEPVPESVLREAFMQIPSATEGTSRIGQVVYVNFQQPEAANDAVYEAKKMATCKKQAAGSYTPVQANAELTKTEFNA